MTIGFLSLGSFDPQGHSILKQDGKPIQGGLPILSAPRIGGRFPADVSGG
jgi:hypothetical protein